MNRFFPIELLRRIYYSFIGNLTGYFLAGAAVLSESFSMDFVVYAIFGIAASDKRELTCFGMNRNRQK